jgi:hypothetical protein
MQGCRGESCYSLVVRSWRPGRNSEELDVDAGAWEEATPDSIVTVFGLAVLSLRAGAPYQRALGPSLRVSAKSSVRSYRFRHSAKSALASPVIIKSGRQIFGAEFGPHPGREEKFSVGAFPQQEIA